MLPPGARTLNENRSGSVTTKVSLLDPNVGLELADRRCRRDGRGGWRAESAAARPHLPAHYRQAALATPHTSYGLLAPSKHAPRSDGLEVVGPDRNRIVEMERADPHMTRGRDGTALPPIREQRPGTRAGNQKSHPPWRAGAGAPMGIRPELPAIRDSGGSGCPRSSRLHNRRGRWRPTIRAARLDRDRRRSHVRIGRERELKGLSGQICGFQLSSTPFNMPVSCLRSARFIQCT